jgi:hypothetical protein
VRRGGLWRSLAFKGHRKGYGEMSKTLDQPNGHGDRKQIQTDHVGRAQAASVRQLAVPHLIALHLVPGALVTAAFVSVAPLVEAAGFPPLAALIAAILLVLVPIELGIVLRAVRRDGGAAAVPYRQRLQLREWLWLPRS